jgi:tetratricopeptide (TPR) repeat protein
MDLSDRTKQVTMAFSPFFKGLRRSQPALPLGCFLVALLFFHPVYGQDDDTGYVLPRDPVNVYLDAIDEIEAEYGPYATELSDLYLGLGQTLMDSGEYERAKDAYHRCVLVLRVNSGPNSPEQTDYLYLIANIETLLGEFKAADKLLHNIYFINSSYYGEDSPEMLPVLERMHDWYVATRPLGLRMSDIENYENLVELTEEIARISELAKGKDHPDTAAAYRQLGESEFQMAYYLQNIILEPNQYTLVQSSADEHYGAGRRAFEDCLESLRINESTPPPVYATALADLGDWLIVFEKSSKSRKLYEQGYEILSQSEEYAELAKNYMSRPQPMYFVDPATLPGAPDDGSAENELFNLEISMTITSSGTVRQVEFLNPPEDMPEDDLKQIKKQVLRLPFRPAMKGGEVVTTEDFIWHYTIKPREAAT